jgi:hypothetical protein
VSEEYMETWELAANLVEKSDDGTEVLHPCICLTTGPDPEANIAGCCTVLGRFQDDDRTRLACAAPALVRALLIAEWGNEGRCADCGKWSYEKHVECRVDAALTISGFPDHASRDASRTRIAEAS